MPYGWDRYKPTTPPTRCGCTSTASARSTSAAAAAPGYAERPGVHRAEEAGEDLRLLYVALTRAQCQVVTWWAPSTNTPTSAAAPAAVRRLRAGRGAARRRCRCRPTTRCAARLAELAARAGAALSVEPVADDPPAAGSRPREAPAGAGGRAVRPLARHRVAPAVLHRAHAGTHEQQLAAAAVAAGVSTEPEERQLDDEAAPGPRRTTRSAADGAERRRRTGDEALRAVPSPMADLPAGAAFGIVVHAVLEHVDTAAPDLARRAHRALPAPCWRTGSARRSTPRCSARRCCRRCRRRSGRWPAGRRLARHRCRPTGSASSTSSCRSPVATTHAPPRRRSAAMADVLRRHLAPGDPFAAYPDLLAALPHQRLRGYLTGSLDAVLRFRDTAAAPERTALRWSPTTRPTGSATPGPARASRSPRGTTGPRR